MYKAMCKKSNKIHIMCTLDIQLTGLERYIVDTTHVGTWCLVKYGTNTASPDAQQYSTVLPIEQIAKRGIITSLDAKFMQ